MNKPELYFKKFKYCKNETKKFNNITISLKSETLKTSELDELGKYPVVNSGLDLYGKYNKYNNLGDAFTIASRGEYVGNIHYFKDKFWAGGLCYPYKCINLYNTRLVSIYMEYNFYTIRKLFMNTTGIPAINKKDLETDKLQSLEAEADLFSRNILIPDEKYKEFIDTAKGHFSTDIIKTFCSEIEKAGFYAMFYCNLNWLNNYLLKDELLPKYDLWLAQWNIDKPSCTCGIWQYSSTGKIDGIDGNVDLDVSYKNYPEIMKFKGLNGFRKSNNLENKNYFNYTVKKGDTLWAIAQWV